MKKLVLLLFAVMMVVSAVNVSADYPPAGVWIDRDDGASEYAQRQVNFEGDTLCEYMLKITFYGSAGPAYACATISSQYGYVQLSPAGFDWGEFPVGTWALEEVQVTSGYTGRVLIGAGLNW